MKTSFNLLSQLNESDRKEYAIKKKIIVESDKTNESKLNEARLTDYLGILQIRDILQKNPETANKEFAIKDNMVVEVGIGNDVNYYKATKNADDEWELTKVNNENISDDFINNYADARNDEKLNEEKVRFDGGYLTVVEKGLDNYEFNEYLQDIATQIDSESVSWGDPQSIPWFDGVTKEVCYNDDNPDDFIEVYYEYNPDDETYTIYSMDDITSSGDDSVDENCNNKINEDTKRVKVSFYVDTDQTPKSEIKEKLEKLLSNSGLASTKEDIELSDDINESEINDMIADKGIQGFIDELKKYDSNIVAKAFLEFAELEQINTRTLINVLNQCRNENGENSLTEDESSENEPSVEPNQNSTVDTIEFKNLNEIKSQGNITMLESDGKFIVGENYNKDTNELDNAEIYDDRAKANEDYLNRCNITGGTSKE